MPKTGRPRLTPEVLQARISEYCREYAVAPNDEGMPPFPTGRRETRQHRDWIAVYKAHNRLARRERGQCERCPAPVSDGSVFCDDHRAEASARAGKDASTPQARRLALEAQDGCCPVCAQKMTLQDSVPHIDAGGPLRALLHPACYRLVALAETLGPAATDRLRRYLWPEKPRRERPGRAR